MGSGTSTRTPSASPHSASAYSLAPFISRQKNEEARTDVGWLAAGLAAGLAPSLFFFFFFFFGKDKKKQAPHKQYSSPNQVQKYRFAIVSHVAGCHRGASRTRSSDVGLRSIRHRRRRRRRLVSRRLCLVLLFFLLFFSSPLSCLL